MKSLSTLTYRYMWTNRKRTITTIVGVSLEADILTGIRGRDYEELQKELYDGGAYKVANIGAAFRMVSFLRAQGILLKANDVLKHEYDLS